MAIKVRFGYQGDPSGGRYIPAGVYNEDDPRLFGLADYLVENGHAFRDGGDLYQSALSPSFREAVEDFEQAVSEIEAQEAAEFSVADGQVKIASSNPAFAQELAAALNREAEARAMSEAGKPETEPEPQAKKRGGRKRRPNPDPEQEELERRIDEAAAEESIRNRG